jgi:hypothetical protein
MRSRGGMRPRFVRSSRPMRAQGRPSARCTRGLVCNMHKEVRTRAYRSSGEHPAFPAQWFDGLCRALPGDEFLLPPSSANSRSCETRSGSNNLRRFSTSHGCQDHTVLPYAASFTKPSTGLCGRPKFWWRRSSAVRLHAVDRSRKNRPANAPHAPDAAASTASHPNVRDDRDTSLVERMRRGNYAADLGETRSGLFSSGRLDGANQIDLAEEISVQAQRGS